LSITHAPIRHFETIDSTNLEAARLVAAAEQGPLWIIADEQQSGKGRLGRQWTSLKGNLYSTLLLPLNAPPQTTPQIGFVVALAVHDTIANICPAEITQLKWPNDCLLEGGKVAGILCETTQGHIIIGCGINIAHSPQGLAYPTSHLQRFNPNATITSVFEAYRTNLKFRLDQWNSGQGFPSVITDWQARAANLNSTITITQGDATKSGIFRGLAPDGALRLEKADGTVELLYAGDVSPVL
jgi:BirA family transcriptional regulator, biotin operon repressor / biotin---[acetyl-CoA-carboxylase] ligase